MKDVITDNYKLLHGDCLERMKEIPDGSVDLILTDPPYGTVNNIGDSDSIEHGMKNKTKWDEVLDFKLMWIEINRILRKNGKCILFSQEPFTSDLIKSATPNVPFSYRCVWIKDHFANSLIAKKAPVNYFEDICVFSKLHDTDYLHPLRDYSKEVMRFIGLNLKGINKRLGHRRAEHFFYVESSQFGLCTKKTYNELISVFGIDSMVGFKTFDELEEINSVFNSVFNLAQGAKFKSNVFQYKKDYSGYHPTQKPVALLEDLTKTYTNENDTVLDFTFGSCSTGIACLNTNRKFIGIELDDDYFDIGAERMRNHIKNE